MPATTMFLVGLMLCLSSDLTSVRGQPTTDQCHSDDNSSHQVALLEQTLEALHAMTGRLLSMESRLESIENRQKSYLFWLKEYGKDIRCRTSVDGNSTCYKLVKENMTWSESRTNCKRLRDGADLVSIETKEENEFLLKMLQDLRQSSCVHAFTSGRKDSRGRWSWAATGRPFNYTYWRSGEPNNVHGNEDVCGIDYHDTYQWNDVPSGVKFCSLCEIP